MARLRNASRSVPRSRFIYIATCVPSFHSRPSPLFTHASGRYSQTSLVSLPSTIAHARFARRYALEDGANRVSAFSLRHEGLEMMYDHDDLLDATKLLFVDTTTVLVSSLGYGRIFEFKYDGTLVGVFATVDEPQDLLFLDDTVPPQIAVATRDLASNSGRLLFFPLAEGLNDGNLNAEDATAQSLPNFAPFSIARVQVPHGPYEGDRILIAGKDPQDLTTTHIKMSCSPGSECPSFLQTENLPSFQGCKANELSSSFKPLVGVPSEGNFLWTCGKSLISCEFKQAESITDAADCVDLEPPVEGFWEPSALVVDDARGTILVSDNANFQIHIYKTTGEFGRSLATTTSLSSLAFKSGVYTPLSPLEYQTTQNATDSITVAISLRDRHDDPIAADYDASFEVSTFTVVAHGYAESAAGPVPIEMPGTISLSGGTVTALVDIRFAGEWRLELDENFPLHKQSIGESPITITVAPGPTVPSSCQLEYNSTITAGDRLTVWMSTFDKFNNPTNRSADEFEVSFDGGEFFPLAREHRQKFTDAGTHRLAVREARTQARVGAFEETFFQVDPAAPSVPACRHSLEGTATFDPSTGAKLNLQAFLFDEFNNSVVDSTEFIIVIDGDLSNKVWLEPPLYRHELAFAEDETREIKIGFLRSDLDHLPNSPVIIKVAPPPDTMKREIAAIVALFLAVIGGAYYKLQNVEKSSALELSLRRVAEDSLRSEQKQLKGEVANLQHNLRKKKHSEDELAVMTAALAELSAARKDELEEVLISGEDLKVERLLGKGGFGVVNLAFYSGQPTAMKQLLTINDDSVKRFR